MILEEFIDSETPGCGGRERKSFRSSGRRYVPLSVISKSRIDVTCYKMSTKDFSPVILIVFEVVQLRRVQGNLVPSEVVLLQKQSVRQN